ncbi:MAG: lactate utilization protein B [Pirellulaceae bacterium]|nr:lactate utilization protein [Planctomycetales bacterium]
MTASHHPQLAASFLQDPARARWHDESLWFVRQKRDRMAHAVPEWEKLREHASQIKQHTMAHLDEYLIQFEQNAIARGALVHWARDAAEHNQIVLNILREHECSQVVKSKSMLTEECHLNPFLERNGIEVVDTDLGERIVQLNRQPPSHIVLPAIHLKKEDVGNIFHQHLGTDAGADDPSYLTEAARKHLRSKFMAAQAGLSGVNFGIAETGGIVVCTNEGNADLGISLPRLHIASMGIEKLIPKLADLAVFTRLLARSATGQPITGYTSHFHGPVRDGKMHIILVDNGRTELLGNEKHRRALHCIRCGACINTCPVYRRSGGFSYHATVPGPIGSTLETSRDPAKYHDLPFACSLCGSCTDVCPVKIDLHEQLLVWRKEIARRKLLPLGKRWSMWALGVILRYPTLFRVAGWFGRTSLSLLPRFIIYNRANAWGRDRDLPPAPRQTFQQWYRQQHAKRHGK